jgi:hypothetical protein
VSTLPFAIGKPSSIAGDWLLSGRLTNATRSPGVVIHLAEPMPAELLKRIPALADGNGGRRNSRAAVEVRSSDASSIAAAR